jgi:hypothetical protein
VSSGGFLVVLGLRRTGVYVTSDGRIVVLILGFLRWRSASDVTGIHIIVDHDTRYPDKDLLRSVIMDGEHPRWLSPETGHLFLFTERPELQRRVDREIQASASVGR